MYVLVNAKNIRGAGSRLIVFVVVAVVSVTVAFKSIAQVGPSLTASVGEVALTKGQLDAELIAEIIASKQAEIKTELAQRLVLSTLRSGNAATYNYVQSCLQTLLTETNKEVITRRLLESSAELMMVYAFAEYYLAELSHRGRKEKLRDYEDALLREMARWSDQSKENTLAIENAFGIQLDKKYAKLQAQDPGILTKATPDFGKERPLPSNKTMQDIALLRFFTNSRSSYREGSNNSNLSPAHFYVDMVYEILRRNGRVKGAGFFKSQQNDSRYGSALATIFEKDPNIHNNIVGLVKTTDCKGDSCVWKSIERRVDKTFMFYNTLVTLPEEVKDYKTETNIRALKPRLIEMKELVKYLELESTSIIGDVNTLSIDDAAVKRYKALCVAARQLLINFNTGLQYSLEEDEKKIIEDAVVSADELLRFDFGKQVIDLEDYRLYLEDELIPSLTVMNIHQKGALKDIITSFGAISELTRKRGLLGLWRQFDPRSQKKEDFNDNEYFFRHSQYYFQIADLLNNLDYAESYEEVFKFLSSLPNAFADPRTKHILNTVMGAYQQYVLIEPDEKKLSIDVESMAVNAYKIYGENSKSRFGMYFSVGINNMFVFNNSKLRIGRGVVSDTKDATLMLPDSAITGTKFVLVSEKLGVRYNFIDRSRRYAMGKTVKNQKPLFSDFHVLAYASGLLYQANFLNSNDQFKSPLYGFGLGTTFFNGLGFTATYAVPMENWFKDGLFSFGFEVRITEYLGAARKKSR